MIKLADIYEYKNGKQKIEFFLLGIYDLLKNTLGFRYCKINGKGYYLKDVNGHYEICNFYELKDAFNEYLKKEFQNLEISKEINFKDFLNEYYKKSPIKNGNFSRQYLGEDFELNENNLNIIKQSLICKMS